MSALSLAPEQRAVAPSSEIATPPPGTLKSPSGPLDPVQPDAAELNAFLGAPKARPWRKRAIWAAALVLLIGGGWLLWRTLTGEDAVEYATVDVRRGALRVTVAATGNLQPTNQVTVGSEQSGLVVQVFVDNNDRVTLGQPLARLDTSRLNDTLLQNQAAVAAAQAGVSQAQATAVEAAANVARLEEVFRLSAGRVPSRTELDTGRAVNARAVASVRSAQAAVTQARALLSSAQTNLSKATILSPVTGVVLSRQIEPGQTVAASFTAPVLFTIAEDLALMQLEVKVDEADVGRVLAGQRATFAVDAFPGRTFPASVGRVDVGANASGTATTTANTVVAYTALLTVDNSGLTLRPGMTATADIVTSETANQWLVPNAALRFTPETAAAASGRGGISLVPRPTGGGAQDAASGAANSPGSRQTLYVVDDEGAAQAIAVTAVDSNGSDTAVSGAGLRAGLKVITGTLVAP